MTKEIFMACLCADCPPSINLVLAAMALDSLREYGNRREIWDGSMFSKWMFNSDVPSYRFFSWHCWKFCLQLLIQLKSRNCTFVACSNGPCLDWVAALDAGDDRKGLSFLKSNFVKWHVMIFIPRSQHLNHINIAGVLSCRKKIIKWSRLEDFLPYCL